MLRNLLVRWKNITNSRSGGIDVMIMVGFFFILMTLSFFIAFEDARINYLMSTVSNVVTDGVIASADGNLHASFPTLRQGNSGSYCYSGGDNDYDETKDTSGFERNLTQLYSLKRTPSGVAKYSSGAMMWEIKDIHIRVDNAKHDVTSTYTITYDLRIPQILLWKGKILEIDNQVQVVNYKNKF